MSRVYRTATVEAAHSTVYRTPPAILIDDVTLIDSVVETETLREETER